jgi:hypothetical protein
LPTEYLRDGDDNVAILIRDRCVVFNKTSLNAMDRSMDGFDARKPVLKMIVRENPVSLLSNIGLSSELIVVRVKRAF